MQGQFESFGDVDRQAQESALRCRQQESAGSSSGPEMPVPNPEPEANGAASPTAKDAPAPPPSTTERKKPKVRGPSSFVALCTPLRHVVRDVPHLEAHPSVGEEEVLLFSPCLWLPSCPV